MDTHSTLCGRDEPVCLAGTKDWRCGRRVMFAMYNLNGQKQTNSFYVIHKVRQRVPLIRNNYVDINEGSPKNQLLLALRLQPN